MIFFSFFKTLEGKPVTLELKNNLLLRGRLHSVDQFLNCKLIDIEDDEDQHPHLMAVSNVFVRGSVVRYIHVRKQDVDTDMLQDAARREYKVSKSGGDGGAKR